MSDLPLPTRLSEGVHKVVFRARRDDALEEFKEAVDRRYVHMTFSETRGGTELGFPIDEERSDLSAADWEKGDGELHLEGELVLDGVAVRCVVDFELEQLEGTGHLDLV